MYTIPDQYTAIGKANVQALLDYANLTAQSAERLLDFQFQTSRAAVAEVLNHAKTLSSAKDFQEWNKVATGITQPAVERATGYARHVQTLLTEVQGEFTKFFDSQVTDFNKRLSATMEQMAQSAPAGSDVAVAAMKSALSAANQAYDAASKAGKQLSELAEASVAAATAGTAAARKKAA